MKLQVLHIQLQPSYAENAGKYVATFTYENRRHEEVKLVLEAGISEQLLGFIGPVITKFAHQAALEVEANIQQSVAEASGAKTLTLPADEAMVG